MKRAAKDIMKEQRERSKSNPKPAPPNDDDYLAHRVLNRQRSSAEELNDYHYQASFTVDDRNGGGGGESDLVPMINTALAENCFNIPLIHDGHQSERNAARNERQNTFIGLIDQKRPSYKLPANDNQASWKQFTGKHPRLDVREDTSQNPSELNAHQSSGVETIGSLRRYAKDRGEKVSSGTELFGQPRFSGAPTQNLPWGSQEASQSIPSAAFMLSASGANNTHG
jgi:hypothetical protein